MLLVGAVILLYLAVTPLIIWLQGVAGLQPAATAALVSLLAGVAVLAVSHQSGLRKRPLVAMLLATALRMIPLLTIGVVVALTRDKSEHLGFVGYLVFFYIVTLAVETYVSVQLARSSQTLASQTLQFTQLCSPRENRKF